MISDIIAFGFSIIGFVSVLFFIIFKMLTWRMEKISISIPLIGCDKGIYKKIYNIRSFCDFCSIKDKCQLVLVSYGAPDWFVDEIREYYNNYSFLKIIDCSEKADEFFPS